VLRCLKTAVGHCGRIETTCQTLIKRLNVWNGALPLCPNTIGMSIKKFLFLILLLLAIVLIGRFLAEYLGAYLSSKLS